VRCICSTTPVAAEREEGGEDVEDVENDEVEADEKGSEEGVGEENEEEEEKDDEEEVVVVEEPLKLSVILSSNLSTVFDSAVCLYGSIILA
jgi:hypothetical protein